MLTYVTAFYPARTDIPLETYWDDFRTLADSGVPILLFVDPTTNHRSLPSNVRVVYKHLPSPPSDMMIPPRSRNEQKDTPEFLWLMLQKLYFMSEALALTETPYLAWVDFRIFHVVRDIPRTQWALRTLVETPPWTSAILAPGCREHDPNFPFLDHICWRYCGGFLLGPRERFPSAYRRQMDLVIQHLPQLTWEVNYWAMMDDVFEWYGADHDDRLITNAVPLSG